MMSCNNTPHPAVAQKDRSVQLIVDSQNLLGEGAFWNHKTQNFWWIDIEGKTLNILDPATRDVATIDVGERIGTVVPDHKGNAILALQTGIFKLDLATQSKTFIALPEPDVANIRLNDGKCDPSGRLWVGSMHLQQIQDAAALFQITADGEVTQRLDSITISNGIVWSADKKTMFYIDTPDGNVKAFDFDNATGEISRPRIVIEISDTLGYPDGMAIDAEGMLWVALWNGNGVSRWNPETGKMLDFIEVPAHNVTSCAFGGSNLDTLYITSSNLDMTEAEKIKFPKAGGLFQVVPGVKGVESYFFGND